MLSKAVLLEAVSPVGAGLEVLVPGRAHQHNRSALPRSKVLRNTEPKVGLPVQVYGPQLDGRGPRVQVEPAGRGQEERGQGCQGSQGHPVTLRRSSASSAPHGGRRSTESESQLRPACGCLSRCPAAESPALQTKIPPTGRGVCHPEASARCSLQTVDF